MLSLRIRLYHLVLPFALLASLPTFVAAADPLELQLRYQRPVNGSAEGSANRFHRVTREESWHPEATALIICDMWDSHHSVNAVRRVAELAPRIDTLAKRLRDQGATIIHAPSSCMAAYQEHPARRRAEGVPASNDFPDDIDSWCDQIPSEEQAAYPLDQSAGGEDDDPLEHQQWAEQLESEGRDPEAPWQAQTPVIQIDVKRDFLSDRGSEIWSILQQRQVSNVMLVGVHTNMCVLGRPFGLRRLSQAGKNVVLCRDLTDTMYDPGAWPYANHFTGTDLIVSHIERYVCPTVSSDQILGGRPHRFQADNRIRLAMLIAEDEYLTEESLPEFAAKHLSGHFSVSTLHGSASQRNQVPGIEQLADADALLVSVRRRALPAADVQLIREFVAQAKPVIGIRTASHAFAVRGQELEPGHAVWPEFDAEVFGGNYSNHYGNNLQASLNMLDASHKITSVLPELKFTPSSSLYKTSPLAPGAHALIEGTVADQSPHPVAWTFIRADSGRSFYTSLGDVQEFESVQFQALLSAGIHWACGLQPHSLEHIERQHERYSSGSGRQK